MKYKDVLNKNLELFKNNEWVNTYHIQRIMHVLEITMDNYDFNDLKLKFDFILNTKKLYIGL